MGAERRILTHRSSAILNVLSAPAFPYTACHATHSQENNKNV